MNTKRSVLLVGVAALGTLAVLVVVGISFAQAPDDGIAPEPAIQYPVEELGGCKDKDACKAYCDKPANMEACVAFAERNNLMSQKEIDIAKKFLNAGGKGPGGCTGKNSCETYCDDISNINECVAFAEQTGILPPEELAEAKQVQSAIARGVKPPPCRNKRECDTYCDDPANIKACVAFGEAAGFLKDKELEEARKMVAAIERGVTPPPCRGREACDAYCSEPDHLEACMSFAKEAGFMSAEESAEAEKMLTAIKKGAKPPACRGKEECDQYCAMDEHLEECMNFAVAAGFMSEKDAEMARKTGGKGPGGCVGREACESFCQDPANQEACMNFAIEHNLISPEELERMKQGGGPGMQGPPPGALENMPPEVAECLESSLGAEGFQAMKRGEFQPSGAEGEKVGQCFRMMGGPPGEGGGPQGMMPPGGEGFGPPQGQGAPAPFTGPGGCTSEESCRSFCESNPGACAGPIGGGEGVMPSEGGYPPPPGAYPAPPEGGTYPDGTYPQPGMTPPPTGDTQYQEQYRQIYEQQYNQQFQEQYQQQYQQQFERQYQQYAPPGTAYPTYPAPSGDSLEYNAPPPPDSNTAPQSYYRPPTLLEFLGMIVRTFMR